jgi:hypothetical protein
MNIGQVVVIGFSLVLALWFLAGTWYNRRRARRIWRWLEAGLDVFGGRAGQVWIGASGAGLRVGIDHPATPFRRLELTARLESRENPPLWLFERAQGKRDQLTLRAWLRAPARGEVEAVPVGSALDRALSTQTEDHWQRKSVSPQWMIAQRGQVREERIEALRDFIAVHDHHLHRLSWRRSEPHLFLQMWLGGLTEESSQELLSRIKETVSA